MISGILLAVLTIALYLWTSYGHSINLAILAIAAITDEPTDDDFTLWYNYVEHANHPMSEAEWPTSLEKSQCAIENNFNRKAIRMMLRSNQEGVLYYIMAFLLPTAICAAVTRSLWIAVLALLFTLVGSFLGSDKKASFKPLHYKGVAPIAEIIHKINSSESQNRRDQSWESLLFWTVDVIKKKAAVYAIQKVLGYLFIIAAVVWATSLQG